MVVACRLEARRERLRVLRLVCCWVAALGVLGVLVVGERTVVVVGAGRGSVRELDALCACAFIGDSNLGGLCAIIFWGRVAANTARGERNVLMCAVRSTGK
jgi:hypothetical protein